MGIISDIPSDFDLTLPYDTLEPVLGTNDLILRFVSESLPASSLGPISEWRSGPSGPNRRLFMTTSANYPSLVQHVTRRVVRFDGINDLLTLESPPTMTTCTLYMCGRFSTVDANRHIIANLGGANIGIDGNKLRVAGSGSSGVLSTTNVNADEWIVFAVTFNGTSVTLSYKSDSITNAAVTLGGDLNLFTLGGTGGLFFGGDIHEALMFDSVHGDSARAQQMQQLREWYIAA
ncbi:hypothetical protein RU09_06040 [Microbacterium sp. MEJ108Y]|uniref:hypothetical protein n=1 Tax=Microbacterium sp. MEJ108Y TaxID=1587523 RepID=UPI0005AD09D5|nr:hypothetical protein [Microbacterium sp. MEJ108Y]KIP93371.1 hypothetical protein RU09_06040 [Microbacterium sp. MEJ108Y]